MKNIIMMCLVICGMPKIGFATLLISDNEFLSLTEGENSITYSGQVSVPIETLNAFINSISHWNNANNSWETYNPGNSSNSLLSLNPSETYSINAKQSFKIAFIALNTYDDVYDNNYSTWETSNWVRSAFTYKGTNSYSLSIIDQFLMRVWEYQSMDHLLGSGYEGNEWTTIPPKLYTAGGSPFNGFDSLSEGKVYIPVGLSEVDSQRAVLIPYSVPEPSALSLLAVGLGGLAILRRRRS